jgi:hypothetical protein
MMALASDCSFMQTQATGALAWPLGLHAEQERQSCATLRGAVSYLPSRAHGAAAAGNGAGVIRHASECAMQIMAAVTHRDGLKQLIAATDRSRA